MLDLFDTKARRGLFLHDKALDLIVGKISRPDNRKVTPRRVTNPPLLSIENPTIPLTFGSGGHPSARARTHERFGEAEAADLLEARHRRQPFLLLLLRSVEINRTHGEAAVHSKECTDR